MTFARSVARVVADFQWYVLAAAGMVAFGLGYAGLAELHPDAGWSYLVFWTLKLFFFTAPGDIHLRPALDVARFLAPIVAGYAGLSALAVLFRDRVLQMRIPLMRGHVVICGLGGYVGSVFLRHLHEKRIRVVVVELDAANRNIELCRSLGVPVIVGDAQRHRTLRAAGAQRASRVLVVTNDDAVNTQIVATWRELSGRPSRPLGCLALITDPEFCVLLRVQETQRGDPELSVDFFNIDEISARLLLEDLPIGIACDQPHIVLAHLDPLGVWLVYHAARAWYDNRGDNNPAKLVVTILDHQPEDRIDALLGQHPALEKVCDFIAFSMSAKDIARLPEHHRDPATPPISRAYVTAYRDHQAFETAVKLRHELDPRIPVVVALSHPHGVAGLLDDVKEAGPLLNIEVFPTMDRTCTAELVRGGSFESMAQAIHDAGTNRNSPRVSPRPRGSSWTNRAGSPTARRRATSRSSCAWSAALSRRYVIGTQRISCSAMRKSNG